MKRSARRVTVLVALVVGLGGVAAAPTPAQEPGANDQYVALGDSFTAGPLIPIQQPDPYGCLRSDHDYPHLAAPALGLPRFRDVSCSGADTDDMTEAQGVSPGPNPPQFDALDADTTVVTVGIGGNDIGFSEIATSCGSLVPFGTPCQDQYVVNGVDEISRRIAETAPKVAAVINGIHDRSPAATVYVVNYLPILPEEPLLPGAPEGCWPQVPIAWDDVPYLRAKQQELNAMLATQAAANGAVLVDAYTAGIGHDACQLPLLRWVEPVVPASPAAPLHPNLSGMQGTADALLAAVGAG
ncbi:MAG: SGNH/GDSL hydrolase family protein [Acidimicrobiia bacterium]